MKPSRCLSCMRIKYNRSCEYCGYWGEDNPYGTIPLENILRGRYLVGRYLGKNNLFMEYAALDLALDRPVILRELFPGDSTRKSDGSVDFCDFGRCECTEYNRKLFLQEAEAMRMASQLPHVLQVYEVFAENQTEYLVTDFHRGGISLGERLRRMGPMALGQAVSLLEPLGPELDAIWTAGIRFWGINTDNILCLPGSGCLLKDFGADPYWWDPDYDFLIISPFQPEETYLTSCSGGGPWDTVFSLCVVLCCCLLGYGNASCNTERLEKQIPRLPVPDSVKAVLAWGMAEKAENRIQSPSALFRELRAAMK